MSYSETARHTYGNKCEWIGCGWNADTCDVHHINYQEQQTLEDALRLAYRTANMSMIALYEKRREEMGFKSYNIRTGQLPKDDDSKNLAVLCPNHHRYLHGKDLGMEVLKYIPARK